MGEIEENLLAPGERLSEEAIALRFGVSRSPVREALRILVQNEIAVIEPRKGARVRTYTPHEASEMFEMRAVLYGLGVELFTQRASDGTIEEYLFIGSRVGEVVSGPDATAQAFAAATQAASAFIMANCGNARLHETMLRMTRRSFRHYAIMAHGTNERRQETWTRGGEMRDAIIARRPREAGAIARDIVERNHQEVMRRLKEAGLT